MMNALARIGSGVGDDAETVFQPFGFGDLRYHLEYPGNYRAVLFIYIGAGADVRLRDNQDVRFRLRIYITESKDLIILVNLLRGYLPFRDPAE